jgi:hypothetical protein
VLSDDSAIVKSIATRVSALLRAFEVDDVDVRQEATALAQVVEQREDVFNIEQREEVASAFKEAMDFKQLMEEAMIPLESLEVDVPMDFQDRWEDSGLWSQDDSSCATDEVLDFLIATLKESCAEGAVTT